MSCESKQIARGFGTDAPPSPKHPIATPGRRTETEHESIARSARKENSMSNQIGDRYTCSDPNCGCEIEIARPCSMISSEATFDEEAPTRREFRSEPISTVGDYGEQGATGEGTFGGAGRGDRSATASGRYDTESTHLKSASGSSAARTLICFCGKQLRQSGTGQRRAQATSAGAPRI
jgi:hypothetical protein